MRVFLSFIYKPAIFFWKSLANELLSSLAMCCKKWESNWTAMSLREIFFLWAALQSYVSGEKITNLCITQWFHFKRKSKNLCFVHKFTIHKRQTVEFKQSIILGYSKDPSAPIQLISIYNSSGLLNNLVSIPGKAYFYPIDIWIIAVVVQNPFGLA